MTVASVTLDALDHKIIHALFVDGRAPFGRLAEVMDASEQTVARRYRRMAESGVIRVVGQLNSQRLGQSDWAIRVRCTPDAAMPLATVLANRPDTAWVQLTSGGTEIFATVRAAAERDHTALLLEQLPSSRRIVSIEAYCLLHVFFSGWSLPLDVDGLTPEQAAQLRPPAAGHGGGDGAAGDPDRSADPGGRGAGAVLQSEDWPLVRALAEDGRATYRQLAARTHWHESTVRRRVEDLIASGVLYFDLDVATDAFGLRARSVLWLSVAPAYLLEAGEALGAHREVPFAAATTGSTNLVASLACRDDYALFEFLTREIAPLRGVTHLQTSPIMRSVKMHSTVPLAPARSLQGTDIGGRSLRG